MARLMFHGNMLCPNCKETLEIKIEKVVITPASPSESRLELYVKKISGIPSLIEKSDISDATKVEV